MTCIVGLKDQGKVWMGGDSQITSNNTKLTTTGDKIFQIDNFLIGVTGYTRISQLIQYSFEPPKRYPDTDVMKYMVTEFAGALRYCLRHNGMWTNVDGMESGEFQLLVGYEGRLFKVSGDLCVSEPVEGFHAIGSGGTLALGALAATEDILDPEKRVRMALEIAEKYDPYTRGPFVIKSI